MPTIFEPRPPWIWSNARYFAYSGGDILVPTTWTRLHYVTIDTSSSKVHVIVMFSGQASIGSAFFTIGIDNTMIYNAMRSFGTQGLWDATLMWYLNIPSPGSHTIELWGIADNENDVVIRAAVLSTTKRSNLQFIVADLVE